MDNFCGTWKQETKAENMEAFMDATGITTKERDYMINMLSKVEIIKKDDKKFDFIHSCEDPLLSKTYNFVLGEPLESTDIFGRKFKSTYNLVNPNLMTETCHDWAEDQLDISYEIKGGNSLDWTIKFKGITAIIVLKKVSS